MGLNMAGRRVPAPRMNDGSRTGDGSGYGWATGPGPTDNLWKVNGSENWNGKDRVMGLSHRNSLRTNDGSRNGTGKGPTTCKGHLHASRRVTGQGTAGDGFRKV